MYDIKEGLTRLDPARGLLTVAVVTPSPSGKKQWTKHKGGVQEGLVSSVTDAADDIVMHSLAWIGAIDLSDQQVVTILDRSEPEREDRGQKQLCFTYHGVRIKLDDGLCCWDGSKRYFIIHFT